MQKVKRSWKINGKASTVEFPPMRRLIDVIRLDLGLTGTKEGCGEGECGACTLLVNGVPMVSCLVPAGRLPDGTEILTVEGLGQTEGGRVLQRAFVESGAVQCGFCIPGMLMSAYSFLNGNGDPSEEEIRRALAGNMCRCTGYAKIVEAVRRAAADWPGRSRT